MSRTAPPRAPLAFRVGVVGHRPDRLQKANLDELAVVVRRILEAVRQEVLAVKQDSQEVYDSATEVLRAISPLAEGTDRIFAEQALDLDYELSCVMPFSQVEYEKDFSAGTALEDDPQESSLHRFQRLAALTTVRFELDGCREDASAAYGAAGRVVLNQSDLLIVVWDGERRNKRGGTEEILDEARRRGVPAIWIDAHTPHSWQLLDAASPLPDASKGARQSPSGLGSAASVRTCVRNLLALPKPRAGASKKGRAAKHRAPEDPQANLKTFCAERQPRRSFAIVWRVFRDVIGDWKFPRVKVAVQPFEEAVKEDWPEDRSTPLCRIVDDLRPFYAWPDKLAVIYSDCYRSTFWFAYGMAAAAVGMALLPLAAGLEPGSWPELICIGVELATIGSLLLVVLFGNLNRWHERWIDYRLAAELVRQLRFVAPLGGGRAFPQIPAHWATYGQPASTWMAWYVRAVERSLGLPTAFVNQEYLNECLGNLRKVVKDQVDFHAVSVTRSHRIEGFLHWFGIMLLVLTVGACGLHLFHARYEHSLPAWLTAARLTFACGFLPALGAALAGIVNQGEFRRIAKRSDAMQEQLAVLLEEIDRLQVKVSEESKSLSQQYSTRAAHLAEDATRLMLTEVLDWRVVFLDRPLVPPA